MALSLKFTNPTLGIKEGQRGRKRCQEACEGGGDEKEAGN
jgi:hypothetical protein